MLRLAVLALLIAASSACVSPARSPLQYATTFNKGIVEGIATCGSAGTIREVRFPDCTKLPCAVKLGNTYTIEVDFVPSASHTVLTLLISMSPSNAEIVHADVPAVVSPGTKHTLNYPWTVANSVPAGLLSLRIQIIGDGVVELCGLATMKVSPA